MSVSETRSRVRQSVDLNALKWTFDGRERAEVQADFEGASKSLLPF
jgi:hypothetical protein